MIDILVKNPDASIPLNSIKAIINSALSAADPYKLVSDNLRLEERKLWVGEKAFPLHSSSRIILVSLGKAAAAMAIAAEEKLQNRCDTGICVCKHKPEVFKSQYIEIFESSHPVPDERSINAALKIKSRLIELKKEDVVLLLLSGGGSALACLPEKGITLEDIQLVTSSLLLSGASINEMNAVRKKLDIFKGGGFLKMAQPAQVGVLVLSDVLGDPLDVIASGPAIIDNSTYVKAVEIIRKYIPIEKIPLRVLELFTSKINEEGKVTPRNKTKLTAYHKVIGSNKKSVNAASAKAAELGYHVEIVSYVLQGEAREGWRTLMNHSQEKPFAIFAGGETTVSVHGDGLGGRNLEFALGAVIPLSTEKNLVIVTLATDGEDGPTDAAGAIVCSNSGYDFTEVEQSLKNNDSYHFFQKHGGLIQTGSTGTNVNDLAFLISW